MSRLFIVFFLFCAPLFSQEETPPQKPFVRFDIVQARYPADTLIENAMQNVLRFKPEADRLLMGQQGPTAAVEARLIQYLASYGTRTKDPVTVNLAGLYGLGKSQLTQLLRSLGIKMIHIDAQTYLQRHQSLAWDLRDEFGGYAPSAPLILVLDEVDKLAEQAPGSDADRAGRAFLAQLGELVTDGKIAHGTRKLDLSNVFLVTCMNLSPSLVDEWLKLQNGPKTFWQMGVDDFRQFHQWVTSENGKHETLGRTFPPQVVGRLGSNTVFFKPLTKEEYSQVLKLNISEAIQRGTGGDNAERRISVRHSENFEDFLYALSLYAPTGARHTVFSANNFMDQLIAYGTYAPGSDPASLTRPREVFLDFDSVGKQIVLQVTPFLGSGKGTRRGKPFVLKLDYDPLTSTVIAPADLRLTRPEGLLASKKQGQVTQEQIRSWRRPVDGRASASIAGDVAAKVLGQGPLLQAIERDIASYLSSKPKDQSGHGNKRVVIGFTGNGKTTALTETFTAAGVPYVRLNMQAYHSDPAGFASTLREKVSKMQWPYAVLLEEGDKVPEMRVDPVTGKVVTIQPPPAIAGLFKELFDKKQFVFSGKSFDGDRPIEIDLTDAYLVSTMNFGANTFNFEPDPRLTDFEVLNHEWVKMQNPVRLKKILRTLFLPDFVNRISGYLLVSNPLTERDHRGILQLAIEHAATVRLGGHAKNVDDNPSRIQLVLSPSYRRYLFSESVVPSEGGRNTFNEVEKIVRSDLGRALDHLRASAGESLHPLQVKLHYRPASRTVVATVANLKTENPPRTLFENPVDLHFPPLGRAGKLTARRLATSLHEFGHAITAALYGERFKYLVVEAIKPGTEGFVEMIPGVKTGETNIAQILSLLGARALERVLLGSSEGRDSVQQTGAGCVADLEAATNVLYGYIYELGQAPQAGIGARTGDKSCRMAKPSDQVQYGNLEAAEGRALQMILVELEDHLVEVLRKNFDTDWYREKIETLARRGVMKEPEFYQLIGRPYPSQSAASYAALPKLAQLFKGTILPEPAASSSARQAPFGSQGKTPEELLIDAKAIIDASMERHFLPLVREPYDLGCPDRLLHPGLPG